jgi:hypothetical protein
MWPTSAIIKSSSHEALWGALAGRSGDSPFGGTGQLLVIAHRTVLVNFDHYKQRFSPRKLIPVNVKTLGDYLLLKRIQADLSQPELAVNTGLTVRKVRAWEHDQSTPTEAEWQVLAAVLTLKSWAPRAKG